MTMLDRIHEAQQWDKEHDKHEESPEASSHKASQRKSSSTRNIAIELKDRLPEL